MSVIYNVIIIIFIFFIFQLSDTLLLFTEHFNHIRLGADCISTGLYTSHHIYCQNISNIIASLSFAIIISAIHTYPGVISDQLLDSIWPQISAVVTPWLAPVFLFSTADCCSTPCVLTLYIDEYKKMWQTIFLEPILFLIEMLPG